PRGKVIFRRFGKVLFLAAVAVQIAAWFAAYYLLYEAVSFFRFFVRGLKGEKGSGTFCLLGGVSTWGVSHRGDPEFGPLLGVALFALAAFNLFTLRRMTNARRRRWCLLILLFLPLGLLALEIGCLAQVRHQILSQHPEVSDPRIFLPFL